MVPNERLRPVVRRLDDDQVEPKRQPRHRRAVGSKAAFNELPPSPSHERALAMVDRLLGKPVRAAAAPADLDHHERGRRARVDRHEIELVAADMDVPGENRPTGVDQPTGNERFRGIARDLRRGSGPIERLSGHRRIFAAVDWLAVNTGSTRARSWISRPSARGELQAHEVVEIERRVVGHDGNELALEAFVGLRGG